MRRGWTTQSSQLLKIISTDETINGELQLDNKSLTQYPFKFQFQLKITSAKWKHLSQLQSISPIMIQHYYFKYQLPDIFLTYSICHFGYISLACHYIYHYILQYIISIVNTKYGLQTIICS